MPSAPSSDGSDSPVPRRAGTPFERARQADIETLRRAYRLLEGSAAAYWERNLRTGEAWYSDNVYRMLGTEVGRPLGIDGIRDRLHPDDRRTIDDAYQRARRELAPFRFDVRYRMPDGEYRWARAAGRAWPGDDGKSEWLIGMIVDVHAERCAMLELEAFARRFERVMSASSEAHFEREPARGAFYVSDRICVLLGHPPGTRAPDERTFHSWVHPDDLPRLRRVIESRSIEPGAWEIDYRLRHVDGNYRHFRSRGRSERDSSGVIRMTGMLDDVHEQMQTLQELQRHREGLERLVDERTAKLEAALAEAQRQREQAEQADVAKSRFLAHMSHEIRTPLNGVIGMTELALRNASSEQQRRHLKLALQSGRTLMRILNDVLDFSRVAAGTAPPRDDAFDLAEAMVEPMRNVMPTARDRGITVMFDMIGDVTRVRGDPQRLQQIIANLLANSARFTESGSIDVVVETTAAEVGWVNARIEVRDTGPGMTPEVAARVFEPFVQGDDSLTRRHGGTGLGLAIALGLAHSMNGELMLETAPGRGTTFTLELPLKIEPGDQPSRRRPPPGVAWLAYTRTLPAQWLARRLDRFGWRSEIVAGVPGLVRRAATIGPGLPAPDLVLIVEDAIDASVPLLDLRAMLPTSRIALMVRPDWSQPQLESAARAANIPLQFAPMTPAAIVEMLEARPPAPPSTESGFLDLPFLPDVGLEVLVAEDNPVNQIIVSEMIDSLGLRTRLSADGEQAIRACRERAPALLLMDLQMPVMDGLQAARQLRRMQAKGELPEFPIVALTAHATPQDRDSCLEAGMVGFLTKPVALGALRSELARWLTV